MVKLFCIFKGQPFQRAFHVHISPEKSVSQLRGRVKDRARRIWGDHIDSDNLAVHAVNIPNRDGGALQSFYSELDQRTNDSTEVYGTDQIIVAFPNHGGGGLDVVFERLEVAGVASPPPPFEPLYAELWGKGESFAGIKKFTVAVPRPEFYLEPGHSSRMEKAGIHKFPLRITPKRGGKDTKVLSRLKTTNRLPCGRKHLLIRSEYMKIETVLEKAVGRKWAGVNPGEDPPQGRCLDYDISGQPGSGKTWFLSYILARRLLRRQPTVYRVHDGKCYLFSEASRGVKVDLEYLCALDDAEKRDLWVLTDKALTDPEWESPTHPWFVILAASPKKVGESKGWEKDRNSGVHYTRNWEWHEIFAAFRYCPSFLFVRAHLLTTVAVSSLQNPNVGFAESDTLFTTYTCFGPVARTCLETLPANCTTIEYNENLARYLGQVDREIRKLAENGGQNLENLVTKDASHRIALMHPSEDCKSYTAQLATRWIVHRMAAATEAHVRKSGFELYTQLSGQPVLRSAAGWFFENYANEWFRNGGDFEADELPVGRTISTIKFSTKNQPNTNYFRNPKDLAEEVKEGLGGHGIDSRHLGRHFQPRSCSQESYDAVVFNREKEVILFQYTLAESHSIKTNGVVEFLKSMPATIKTINIIFVVPESRAGDYVNAQRVPDRADLGRGKIVQQWRLVFSDDQIQRVVLGRGVKNRSRETSHRGSASEGGAGEGDAPEVSALGKRAHEESIGGESPSGEVAPKESARHKRLRLRSGGESSRG